MEKLTILYFLILISTSCFSMQKIDVDQEQVAAEWVELEVCIEPIVTKIKESNLRYFLPQQSGNILQEASELTSKVKYDSNKKKLIKEFAEKIEDIFKHCPINSMLHGLVSKLYDGYGFEILKAAGADPYEIFSETMTLARVPLVVCWTCQIGHYPPLIPDRYDRSIEIAHVLLQPQNGRRFNVHIFCNFIDVLSRFYVFHNFLSKTECVRFDWFEKFMTEIFSKYFRGLPANEKKIVKEQVDSTIAYLKDKRKIFDEHQVCILLRNLLSL